MELIRALSYAILNKVPISVLLSGVLLGGFYLSFLFIHPSATMAFTVGVALVVALIRIIVYLIDTLDP
jgi:hypothetical protein